MINVATVKLFEMDVQSRVSLRRRYLGKDAPPDRARVTCFMLERTVHLSRAHALTVIDAAANCTIHNLMA